MSNKMLIALDGGDDSKRALSAAVTHAKSTSSDLVLAYVIDWSLYDFHTPQELEERHQRRESEVQRVNDSILAPKIAALKADGLNVDAVVHHGTIAKILLELGDQHGVTPI